MTRFLPWISCLAALILAPGLSRGAEYKLADLTKDKLVERLNKFLSNGGNQAFWDKKLKDKAIPGTVDPKNIRGEKSPFEWTFIVDPPLSGEQADDLKKILSDFLKEATGQYDPNLAGGLLSMDDHEAMMKALKLTTKKAAPPNAPPTIALTPASMSIEAGKEGSFAIALADKETPAGKLKVSVKSEDETKFPAASVKITGSGAERAGSLLAPKLAGDFKFTITVADEVGATASATLSVKTTSGPPPVNTAPTIALVPTGLTIVAGTEVTFEIAVGDSETPAEKLNVAVRSDSEAVFAASAVRIRGTGKLRQGSISVPNVAAGEYRLTFTVTDDAGKSAAAILILTRAADPIPETPTSAPATATASSCGCGLTTPLSATVASCGTPCPGPIRRLFRSPCRFDRTPQMGSSPVFSATGSCGSSAPCIAASGDSAPATWTAAVRPAPLPVEVVTRRQLLAITDPSGRNAFFELGLRHYWAGSTAQAVEYLAAASATSEDASLWTFFALALTAEGSRAEARDAARYAAALQALDPMERIAVLDATERVQGQQRRALAEMAGDIADVTAAAKVVRDHRKKLEFDTSKSVHLDDRSCGISPDCRK